MVRAAEIAILAPIPLGTTLIVSTAVTGLRRVWARRRTEARLADGTLAAWGHTDWVVIDRRGMPGRVPPEFPAAFAVPPGSFEPGRVPLREPPPDAVVHRATVRPQDLDPMGHVNNAAYVDYLEEVLHAAGEAGRRMLTAVPRRVRLEYVAAAAPGARLAVRHGRSRRWAVPDGRGGWPTTTGRSSRGARSPGADDTAPVPSGHAGLPPCGARVNRALIAGRYWDHRPMVATVQRRSLRGAGATTGEGTAPEQQAVIGPWTP